MDKKKTGELIRQARTGKKYTQTELGDMLHRLSSMEEAYEMFYFRKMVVIIEAVISIIAVVVLKKVQSKK